MDDTWTTYGRHMDRTTRGRHMDDTCQHGETVHSSDEWGEWGPTWICAEMGAVVMSTLGVHTSGEQTCRHGGEMFVNPGGR